MKRFSLFLFLAAGGMGLSAQTIVLKSGEVVSANNLVRQEDMLMTSVKSSTGTMGQVGLHVSDVAELNLPPPEVLTTAPRLTAQGKYDQALAQIQPVVEYQKTLRDIPGNWWAKSVLVEIPVLLALNRAADAQALASDVSSFSRDPEILIAAKLQLALATDHKDPRDGLAVFDSIISQSTDPQTLSRAWIAEGDIRLAQHEFDEALLAYLTVTVFYPEHDPLVPKALWGSGQAYARLKDTKNATKTWQNLISTYPDSPEAALAKTELMKKEKKT